LTIVLASQSQSRKAMMDQAGIAYETLPAHVDEATIKDTMLAAGENPREIADALAEAKARRVAMRVPGTIVIGSDSIAHVENRIFDKPESRDIAREHLTFFSGKRLELTSAVVAARDGEPVWRFVDRAILHVRELSPAFIEAYLDLEWPEISYCAGCFRFEGAGVRLFSRVSGDVHTILGMPLLPLCNWLRACGELES
jgi:septum formation protein